MAERKNPLFRIQVYVRQRPYTKSEINASKPSAIKFSSQTELVLKCGANEKNYTFDRVFAGGAIQAEVYDVVVRPLVDSMLLGCTCTVFAYGPTGTGKTYTMVGDTVNTSVDFINDPSVGMVPRAATDIFDKLSQLGVEYNVSVSYVEIYNEEIRDLLCSDGPCLRIYDDPDNRGATCIKGVSEVPVKDCNELFEMLMIGANDRHIADTNINRQSSRSHTIFTILVTIRELSNGEEIVKTGKIHLIDLAGSENVGRSGATDLRARQAGTINKSLLTLAKVIKALAFKSPHVPYRESKLTRILQDSLGGKSKTCIIATFSPCSDVFEETVSTLDYAHMARSVSNCPTYNVKNIRRDNMIKDLEDEVTSLRQEINAAREGEGFFMDNESYEKLMLEIKVKRERVLCLTAEITTLNDNIRSQKQCAEELGRNYFQSVTTLETLKKELEEETVKQEESEYAIVRMSDNLSQVKQQSRALCDVYQTSTKLGEIYYQKYNSQCDATLHNAKIAKEMVTLSSKNLRGIENTLEQFVKNGKEHLAALTISSARIKDNVLMDSERLEQLFNEVAVFSEKLKCTFETLFKNSEFTERDAKATLTSTCSANHKLVAHNFRIIKTDLGKLKEHIDETRASLAEATFQYNNDVSTQFSALRDMYDKFYALMNALRVILHKRYIRVRRLLSRDDEERESWEQLIRLFTTKEEDLSLELEPAMHVKGYITELVDLLKERSQRINQNLNTIVTNFNQQTAYVQLNELRLKYQTVEEDIKDSQRICSFQISQNHRLNQGYFAKFFDTIEKRLEEQNKGVVAKKEAMTKEAFDILESQTRVTTDFSTQVTASLDHFIMNENRSVAKVVEFSQHTVENLQGMLGEVNFIGKSGDTPVKPTYDYPKKISSGLSKEVLKKEFKKSILQEIQDNESNEPTTDDN
ncbi:kinesin-like protein KIF11 [Tribolium madens]|uniref:kinesin-like protein KIF11 n=1 Tax=Tribolium madens TaxID=41895 RepID=UPI001CF74FB4|nr:kinesin-like protein KIF11 [Tribolium madens]